MPNRPRPTHVRPRFGTLAAFAVLGFALGLAGCANPSFIGVQDYGDIGGNVVDTASKPIAGAVVSATGTTNTVRSNADGSFVLAHVAIGQQTVNVGAAGYGPPASAVTVTVTKDGRVSAGNIVLPSITNAPQ